METQAFGSPDPASCDWLTCGKDEIRSMRQYYATRLGLPLLSRDDEVLHDVCLAVGQRRQDVVWTFVASMNMCLLLYGVRKRDGEAQDETHSLYKKCLVCFPSNEGDA